jgi:hypothetical protein
MSWCDQIHVPMTQFGHTLLPCLSLTSMVKKRASESCRFETYVGSLGYTTNILVSLFVVLLVKNLRQVELLDIYPASIWINLEYLLEHSLFSSGNLAKLSEEL